MTTMTAAIVLGLLLVLPAVLGQRWADDGDENSYVDLPGSESRALGGLFNVQRRRNWCARWGDYCVRDAKVKLARCCTGLRCMCSELWRRGCVCRQPPTFG